MSAPRKVHVIKTKYFDILYSDLSKPTADLLMNEADGLYERAMEYFGTTETFRMPIIISPDSDSLSVSYSPSPYNRIVLYEGVPQENQIYAENTLLQLFYEQVLLAVNESLRSPFVNFIHKIISSDALQPVVLLNMPFSFREGIANEHMLDDFTSVQILAQAKLEGEFPTWFQVSAVRDIEPGTKLASVAGAAFTAYIQQRWGFEKYAEYWQECTKVSVLFTAGIFNKVYPVTLDEAWSDFEDSIPLPISLQQTPELEQNKIPFFWNDKESRYDSILASDYGIIWYDDVRHEVDIFDYNSPIKARMLLFLGDSIEKMSLSPDGRYLSVTFNEYRKRSNFILKLTKVFDLKEREYVSESLLVRDGTMLQFEDGSYGLAGVKVSEGYPEIQVYKFDSDWNEELIYHRAYDYNTIPASLTYAGAGKISFIQIQDNERILCQLNFTDETEKKWDLGNIQISNLKYCKAQTERYIFQYVPEEEYAFTRMGYIELNSAFEPKKVMLQTCDLDGGVYSPVFVRDLLYYSSHKLYYDEFITFPTRKMPFEEAAFTVCETETKLFQPDNEYLNAVAIHKYNPLKYWAGGTTYPFIGAVDVDLDTGIKMWPGLGMTYKTQADPFKSTEMTFSGAYKLADMEYSSDSDEENQEKTKDESDYPKHRDFSFTGYIKNTSTPFDIEGATVFDFAPDGKYDWKWMAGTAWNVPLGLNFRKLRFNIQSESIYSNEYYDSNFKTTYPDKKAWIGPVDAYQTMTATVKAEYENMNQYGLSTFEKRGFRIGTRVYAFWDSEKVREVQEKAAAQNEDVNYEDITGNNNEMLQEITQLNVGLNALVAIPRMTPLQMNNGWILSVPGTMYLEIMGKNGTALETYGEMLLIGKEIQNGFPGLYLYFNRCGLKAGYDLALKYNLTETQLPDLRSIKVFYDVFANTYPQDHVYLKFDLDVVSPVGKLSTIIFKGEFKASYFIRTNDFKFSVNVDINM